jgi:hypothetical protein
MTTQVSLADITKAVRKNRPPGEKEEPEETLSAEALCEIPLVPEVEDEEPEEEDKKPGKKKTKSERVESESLDHILAMGEAIRKVYQGAKMSERAKRDPMFAAQLLKDYNLLVKSTMSFVTARIRLEELRLQRDRDKEGSSDGSKNVFIIQGLYDSSKPQTLEIQAENNGPVKFITKGLDN